MLFVLEYFDASPSIMKRRFRAVFAQEGNKTLIKTFTTTTATITKRKEKTRTKWYKMVKTVLFKKGSTFPTIIIIIISTW